mgnify:FL=1
MKKISRKDAIHLIVKVQNIIEKKVDLSKYFSEDQWINSIEEKEVDTDFQGVSNGFLSEIIQSITGYKVEVCGEVEVLLPCPCCGFRTLTESYNPIEGTGYDICPYCNWEDDGTIDANTYRSINRGSIADYRQKIQENFNQYYINKWIKDSF